MPTTWAKLPGLDSAHDAISANAGFAQKAMQSLRPEGPSFNSHDRQVVVKVLRMIEEVRRTGMNPCRPFGPHVFPGFIDTPT